MLCYGHDGPVVVVGVVEPVGVVVAVVLPPPDARPCSAAARRGAHSGRWEVRQGKARGSLPSRDGLAVIGGTSLPPIAHLAPALAPPTGRTAPAASGVVHTVADSPRRSTAPP
jgi:hypothetical protein